MTIYARSSLKAILHNYIFISFENLCKSLVSKGNFQKSLTLFSNDLNNTYRLYALSSSILLSNQSSFKRLSA